MINRTEQFIQLISKVHSMYLALKIFGVHKALFSAFGTETNRKRFETCNLIIRPVKVDGAVQA